MSNLIARLQKVSNILSKSFSDSFIDTMSKSLVNCMYSFVVFMFSNIIITSIVEGLSQSYKAEVDRSVELWNFFHQLSKYE